jgi:hypothetical protein
VSDITKQKVYDAAKRWVADAEAPLDELIAAIKEHRTAERDEQSANQEQEQTEKPAETDEAKPEGEQTPVQEPAQTDPPAAA